MNTHSLRARLTLWYTMTLVVVLLLFGVDVLLVQQRFGMRRADRELETVNATLVNLFREELGELDDPATAATEAITAIASLGDAAAILDEHRRYHDRRNLDVEWHDLVGAGRGYRWHRGRCGGV